MTPDAALPRTQLAADAQNISNEPPTEIQELKQSVSELQRKAEELEKRFETLQNE